MPGQLAGVHCITEESELKALNAMWPSHCEVVASGFLKHCPRFLNRTFVFIDSIPQMHTSMPSPEIPYEKQTHVHPLIDFKRFLVSIYVSADSLRCLCSTQHPLKDPWRPYHLGCVDPRHVHRDVEHRYKPASTNGHKSLAKKEKRSSMMRNRRGNVLGFRV